MCYKSKDNIFHYTKVQTALEYILSTLELRFNKFLDSNDPREYKDSRIGPRYNVIIYDDDRMKKIQENIIQSKLEQYKVICFCINPQSKKSDRYGWRKPRMWAQYSVNHNGVCLVFSKSKLANQLNKSFKKKNIFYGNVGYTDFCYPKFKQYQLIDKRKLSILTDEEYIEYHIRKHKSELYFLKDIDFKDENEFRIILKDNSPEYQYINILSSLIGIILGDKTPKVYIDLFQSLREQIQTQHDNIYFNDKIKINLDRMHFYEGLPTIQHIK